MGATHELHGMFRKNLGQIRCAPMLRYFFDRVQETESGVVYNNIEAAVDGPRFFDHC